jgi:hypothetical protein
MRRALLVAFALALAGCSGVKDLFTAHANEAAFAGQQHLSTDRLAAMLAGAKGVQLNRESAEFVANVWIDYSLFAQAIASRTVINDSTTAAAAMWPELAEVRGSHWHDTLMARRSHFTPASADSVYGGTSVRLVQHILIPVRPNSTPEEKAPARKKAEALVDQLRKGANFGALAAANSGDPGSARDSGYLPPSPRGAFVPSFDSVTWALKPGQTSGIVESPFGFHIIRRPPADAVRERLIAWLQQSTGTRLDSLYMDSLGVKAHLTVLPDAPKAMKGALDDPQGQATSTRKIADFNGGGLTVAEFLRWVRALPPQYVGQLRSADTASLKNFAKIISSNVLLLREADSAHIGVTPDEWKTMLERYRTQLDTLRLEMGLEGADLSDSTVRAADRMKVADLKVEQYFDDVIAGKRRLRPLPATLGPVLRSRTPWGINQAGVTRALELARAKQSADTAGRGKRPGAAPPGAMQPAPGPAPVPNGAVPDTVRKPETTRPGSRAPDSAAKH